MQPHRLRSTFLLISPCRVPSQTFTSNNSWDKKWTGCSLQHNPNFTSESQFKKQLLFLSVLSCPVLGPRFPQRLFATQEFRPKTRNPFRSTHSPWQKKSRTGIKVNLQNISTKGSSPKQSCLLLFSSCMCPLNELSWPHQNVFVYLAFFLEGLVNITQKTLQYRCPRPWIHIENLFTASTKAREQGNKQPVRRALR